MNELQAGYKICIFKKSQCHIMKKELNILLAGSVGLLTVLGIIGLRKILKNRSFECCTNDADLHEIYGNRYQNEDKEGVEFLALL